MRVWEFQAGRANLAEHFARIPFHSRHSAIAAHTLVPLLIHYTLVFRLRENSQFKLDYTFSPEIVSTIYAPMTCPSIHPALAAGPSDQIQPNQGIFFPPQPDKTSRGYPIIPVVFRPEVPENALPTFRGVTSLAMGSTGHWPVPSGDSPDGSAGDMFSSCPSLCSASHSRTGRQVADRNGRVARSTHVRTLPNTARAQVPDGLATEAIIPLEQ
jgi:hypothetical protein